MEAPAPGEPQRWAKHMNKNNDIKDTCPICENQYHSNDSVCSFCGYGFKNGLVDDDKLKNYMALLKSSREWAKEIIIKYNFNEFKIKKHGFSSTNPERGGWSITKTGDFFSETKATTTTDINLAKAVIAHPNLLSCRNKTEAKKRALEISRGNARKNNLVDFEDSLQNYISKNWEELPFGEDWKIYNRSLFSKGKYNTQEIGEIDLLAKHKTMPKWLIIELKKDQSSDATVGQILRYMGWVKENLSEENETVEGLIIAGTEDDRIQYALKCLKNISLKIYQLKSGKLSLNNPMPIGLASGLEKLTKEEKKELLKQLIDMRK
jgi:ribosomal protein L37E